MKRVVSISLLVVLLVAGAMAQFGGSKKQNSAGKTLVGFVFDRDEKPLPNAIVYLKDTKTLGVKTFIADNDAAYRFPALSPNVDYEVWAEFKGQKSDTKTLSSFDTRQNVRINLKVK